jgi:glycosyltransferase involved in cell wall biosynthesis
MKVLVVVPALNEAASIAHVVTNLRTLGYDVLVVSDGSTDETARIAESSGARVLQLVLNLGVGGALRVGFAFARDHGYDAVVQVDADGQHPSHQIADLITAATTAGADMVIGSRYLSPDASLKPGALRRLAMWLLARAASRASATRITDSTSGFRLIREPLLGEFSRHFSSYYLGDTFEAVVAAGRAGFRIVEIPAALAPRMHGNSTSSSVRSIALIAKVLLLSTLRFHHRLDRRR